MSDDTANSAGVDQAALDRATQRAADRAAKATATAALVAALAEASVSIASATGESPDISADARADIAVDALAALISTEPMSDVRRAAVRVAVGLGASVNAIREIVGATRVSKSSSISLPPGRYAHLSRGRNWQRRSDGEFVDGPVGPGVDGQARAGR